jgi:low temperature requirement protein LtrA
MRVVLLIPFAIVVFAVVIYVYAVKALDEPRGTRWLWFASVVAASGALALTGDDVATPVKVAAWLITLALLGLLASAKDRAQAQSRR